jgi:uncharacterized protein (DUF1501 family)
MYSTRREFLIRSLQGTSLLAVGSVVPQFLANTALAAEASRKDTVLVVIELTGGNDGLNTVIPYGDDLYHKARKSLRLTKEQVLRIDDHIGLNPGMQGFKQLLDQGQLAIVQGVGYPNPDRSHFESMDVWQSGDPKRQMKNGWLARGVPSLQDKKGNVPILQIGEKELPLALQGAPQGVISINDGRAYRLDLGADPARQKARRQLIEELARTEEPANGSLLQFVQRRQLQTYTTLDRLKEVLENTNKDREPGQFNAEDFDPQTRRFRTNTLQQKLQLIARLIAKDLGTRVFYVSQDGYDTHSNQADEHRSLLSQLSNGLNLFFTTLQQTDHAKRVVTMTFSEFGRRVQENGSKGTDHGAASCLFVAGPAVKAGLVGKHPNLTELDAGDLKFHTDFRQVYATLLDRWLGCDSQAVLGGKFEHLHLLQDSATKK